MSFLLHCTLSLAEECIVIGPVCVFVGLLPSVTMTTRNYKTGSVGESSDHLQLITFWPSRNPGKGVCGGAKIFGSATLQPAHSVCVSLSAFFHLHM